MKNYYSYILFFILLGCNKTKSYEPFFQEGNGTVFNDVVVFEEIDKITLPLDQNSAFRHYSFGFNKSNTSSDYYYSFLNDYEKSIVYYNLNNKEIKKIFLKEEGRNGVGSFSDVSTNLFESENDFYFYNSSSATLFNLDSLGVVKSKYKVTDYKTTKDVPFPEPSGINPFVIENGIAYFSCSLDRPQYDYSNYGMILKYDLKKETADYIVPFPGLYNKDFWGASFRYLSYFHFDANNEKIILTYPVSPFVYSVDLKNKSKDSAYVGSKHFKTVEPMRLDLEYAFKQDRDFKREDNFSLTNSDYFRIIYDEHNEYYYRFTYIRPTLEERTKGFVFPDFSIIILNKDFEKLGEQVFSSTIYDNNTVGVTDKGLLIARKDLYNTNEDEITFSVFNPVKKTNE
jgi:hypothetical protein